MLTCRARARAFYAEKGKVAEIIVEIDGTNDARANVITPAAFLETSPGYPVAVGGALIVGAIFHGDERRH